MSKNLTPSHAIQGGRIGSPKITTPQTVTVEPHYFVEFPTVGTVTINGEPDSIDAVQWYNLRAAVKSLCSPTVAGGDVFRLTISEMQAARRQALEATQKPRSAVSAALTSNDTSCGFPDCYGRALDCDVMLGIQMDADWDDQRNAESYPFMA